MSNILIAQSWRVGAATLSKPWHIIAKRADGTPGPSLTALCGTETGGERRATRTAFEDFRLDGALKRCNRCVMAHRRGGAYEVAETPAPLDIPAAVRAYIEAEWRGAALVMSAKRGEITAALLAADPELSNTAATFRFHNLVAEMRDNDEISPETLARIAPQAKMGDGPRFPEGTPEYEAYRAELAVELAKFAKGEAPYEFDPNELGNDGGRAARATGIGS